MPFPLLISLRESLLELCCALPVAAALGVPLQAGSRTSRAAALWVCKAIALGVEEQEGTRQG